MKLQETQKIKKKIRKKESNIEIYKTGMFPTLF